MTEDDLEYAPLPHYTWDERPTHVPLTTDEAATALHLEHGSVSRAATRLKVSSIRLSRFVRNTPSVMRVYQDHAHDNVFKSADEYIHALWDPDSNDRRRELAASKVLTSRAAAAVGSPYAPAGSNPTIGTEAGGRIVICWEGDDGGDLDPRTLIEGTTQTGQGEDSVSSSASLHPPSRESETLDLHGSPPASWEDGGAGE